MSLNIPTNPSEITESINSSVKTFAQNERTFNIGLLIIYILSSIFFVWYFNQSMREMRTDYLAQIEKTETRAERMNLRAMETIDKHTLAINELLNQIRK